MWSKLLEFFEDPTKHVYDEQFLTMVAKDVNNLSKKNLKQYSQLFQVAPTSLRTVSEVFNPDRFGPSTQKFGLNRGQVFDIELGDDLLQPSAQQSVLTHIRNDRPGLTIISSLWTF